MMMVKNITNILQHGLFCSIITAVFFIDIVLFLTNSKKVFLLNDGIFFLPIFLVVALFFITFSIFKEKKVCSYYRIIY